MEKNSYNPFEYLYEKISNLEAQNALILAALKTSINQTSDKSSDQERFDITEAAKFLGLSKGYLYILVSEKKVPFHKRSGKLRFYKSELDEWIRSGESNSNQDIENRILANG